MILVVCLVQVQRVVSPDTARYCTRHGLGLLAELPRSRPHRCCIFVHRIHSASTNQETEINNCDNSSYVTVTFTDTVIRRPYLVRCHAQCCVCLSVVCTECIVAKRCVLEQKLLWTAYRKSYEKSIGTKMNGLDLCLEVVLRWRQPLWYIRRWIHRKPLEIEAWFQRTTNRKWHIMGYQVVTWPIKHVTPKVLCGSTVGYPSDSLFFCVSTCICALFICITWLAQLSLINRDSQASVAAVSPRHHACCRQAITVQTTSAERLQTLKWLFHLCQIFIPICVPLYNYYCSLIVLFCLWDTRYTGCLTGMSTKPHMYFTHILSCGKLECQ